MLLFRLLFVLLLAAAVGSVWLVKPERKAESETGPTGWYVHEMGSDRFLICLGAGGRAMVSHHQAHEAIWSLEDGVISIRYTGSARGGARFRLELHDDRLELLEFDGSSTGNAFAPTPRSLLEAPMPTAADPDAAPWWMQVP